ncbi:hypothetical protein [Parabacteroides sp. FAFU027]|uniref:hypothetical protein n=1 Tax=Parabacteroides sp. FAFU027 TaxID=2922715 RepID=UPI001FAE973F|nr:hypothetical protein [Parabacteroides sp. FAFU027]
MKNNYTMNFTRTFFLAIIFCLFISFKAKSQTPFTIHAGPSTVLNNNKFKNLSVGVDLGVEYKLPIQKDVINLICSADFMNDKYLLPNSIKTFYSYNGEMGTLPETKYIRISNVPLLAGISLPKELSDEVHLFISGAIGPDFMFVPKVSYTAIGQSFTEIKSDVNTLFTYKLNAGIIFDDQYSLRVEYFNFNGKVPEDLSRKGFAHDPIITVSLGMSF